MTAQVRDIIIIEGQAFELNATPLEAYFDRIGWRAEFSSLSSANWRGYVARWEVHGKRLFLTGLFGANWIIPPHLAGKVGPDPDPFEPAGAGEKSLRLVDLFPAEAPLVFANWVTQSLVIPTGPQLVYKHFGFENLHASYRRITVVQGRMRGIRNFEGREWARKTGRLWPDDDWYAEHPLALVWSEAEAQEDDGELPDWRSEKKLWYRHLLYETAQVEALRKPCGALP